MECLQNTWGGSEDQTLTCMYTHSGIIEISKYVAQTFQSLSLHVHVCVGLPQWNDLYMHHYTYMCMYIQTSRYDGSTK